MTNIILCGGNGTRLWPISRTLLPKQFVKLFNSQSLFQLTLKRNQHICQNYMIVSNAEQYFLAVDQIEDLHIEIDSDNIKFLLEPVGRNTAPAIALACLALEAEDIVLVTPSDHLIKDEVAYTKAIVRAEKLAKENNLVTFGIIPEFPETGFGYIEALNEDVKAFHEKPDILTAKVYVNSGNYYWNSGMFCFKAGVYLKELKQYAPEIYETSLTAFNQNKKSSIICIEREAMNAIPDQSIDYAVMEKSDHVKMVVSDIGWSDLGSFDALSQEFEKDSQGNTLNQNLIAINANDNFVYANERMVTLADVNDLIIVDTPDALLISKKRSSQKIKDIVKELKGRESNLHHMHLTVHRPWGTYTILEEGKNYKIKRIVVKQGKRLSLQKHFHRSEHWVVVSGIALVTLGNQEILIKPNESTYIPIGEIHRLENPGKYDVVLIETQVGDYLEEDDIVRIDDDYQRS